MMVAPKPKETWNPPPPVSEPMSVGTVAEIGRRPGKFTPPRIVINAVPGWGKTTIAAHTPSPSILMTAGETGYDDLLGAGRVPDVDAAVVDTWPNFLATLDHIRDANEIPYKTLCIDAIDGAERMMHEEVCRRDYEGDWGEKGFTSFQRGYDTSINDWLGMLSRLEKIQARGVMILMLCHSQIKPFKNPLGEDFDRYVTALHHKTWAQTHKWAGAVLFGKYRTIPVKEKAKTRAKGGGGEVRVIYTEERDAFDAKNRYGMPFEIEIPNDPTAAWSTIWKHIYPPAKDKTKEN